MLLPMKRWLPIFVSALAAFASASDFTLTVLHTNDMHARVEPTKVKGEFVGGYARQMTLIKKYMASDPNVLLINAGDTFQGTLFFNQYQGIADLAYMNAAGYRAMTLGNHEFDKGPAVLANFIKKAAFPVLAANLDVSQDADLKGLVKPSCVVEVVGQKIGIVGAITDTLMSISSPGKNVRLKPLVSSIQTEIDAFTKAGINKVIILTHIGYQEDLELATKLHDADLIVGGHSHTFLSDDEILPFGKGFGGYPTKAKAADGKAVYVVQAHEWGKVLGRLKITFDGAGNVTKVFDAKPIKVDASIPEDPTIAAMVSAFNMPLAELKRKVVGESPTGFANDGARMKETPMGNVIADAMLAMTKNQGAQLALMNAGGIRSAIEPGLITFEAAISVQPFTNTLVLLDLTGAELMAAFDFGLGETGEGSGGFLHTSKGVKVVFEPKKPAGSRVASIEIGGKKVLATDTVRVVTNSFLAGGGDGHVELKNATGKRLDTGYIDVDALVDYLLSHKPMTQSVEGRLVTK